MKKLTIFIIGIAFIISVVFIIFAISFNSQKQTELDEAKTAQKSSKINISGLEAQSQQNSVLLNKIKSDPSILVDEAKEKTQNFIEIVNANENKADSDKAKIYKDKLSNVVNEDLLKNENLTSINIPKDYSIDIATNRGEAIPVLISNEDKYLIITYDTFNQEIQSVREYKKAWNKAMVVGEIMWVTQILM